MPKLRPLFIAGALSLLASGIAFAVPSEVEEAFAGKYSEIKNVEWEVDSNGNWEAQFTVDDEELRADFTPAGAWIETEKKIAFENLPDPVQEAIRREFGDEEISELEQVDHAERGNFYDVEFKKRGPNYDVEYDDQGKRVTSLTNMVNGLNRPIGELGTKKSGAEEMGRLELIVEFSVNLLTIFLFAYCIYYRRHHDHQMLFLLFGFNLFLFPIFLLSASLTAGFGFTIFALLALVRLRSDTFSKTEVAYLLGAVALTFINAMLPAHVEYVSSFVVLATAWAGDHPRVWRDAYQSAHLRFKVKENENKLNQDYLCAQIAEEFKVEVSNIEIERVDKNIVRLLVIYRDRPEVRLARAKRAIGKRRWKRNALEQKRKSDDEQII